MLYSKAYPKLKSTLIRINEEFISYCYSSDNNIIASPVLHAPVSGQKFDLEIRYYGSKPASYRLYDDDGESYGYEKGAYSWREIKVLKDKKGKFTGTISKAEKGKPDNIGKVTWKFMSEE